MTLRDRTYDFHNLIEEMRARKEGNAITSALIPSDNYRNNNQRRNPNTPFGVQASSIGKSIAAVYDKLERLTKLAKKKSLYDDPTEEIQQLTVIINNDIKNLNSEINRLQQEKNLRRKNKHTDSHSDSIVEQLSSKLKSATKAFSNVLELRNTTLKDQQKERDIFTKSSTGRSARMSESSLYKASSTSDPGDGEVAIPMPNGGGQQLALMSQDRYLQSRAEAVATITRTIAELQGMFAQLANIVDEQQHSLERIDANLEDTSSRMSEAQNELIKYLNSVSSNRSLIIKVFLVVFVFVVLFFLLFA